MQDWLHWLISDEKYRIDYGEQFLKSIIMTKYAKRKLSMLVMLMLTVIVRMHILSVLSIVMSINPYVDAVTQVVVAVIVTLKSHIIFNIISNFDRSIYRLVDIVVKNYTPEKFRLWKKVGVSSICMYLIIILMFIEVNNALLINYIVQFLVIYYVIDQIEQKKFEQFINRIRDKPKRIIYGEFNIVNDYYEEPENNEDIDEQLEMDYKESEKMFPTKSKSSIKLCIMDDYYKVKNR